VTTDRAVAEIARRQHGLVALAQARECGLSSAQISVRVGTGRWSTVRRGVFLVNGVPPTWEQVVRAACLATADVAAASGLTAGRLWGLRLPRPEQVELTTPPGRQVRLAGVRHHRRSDLSPVDLTGCRGIPTTNPARTLVDTSGEVPPAALGVVVDDALRRRLVTLGDLRACHQRVDTGPGRRALIAMRAVLAERQVGYDPGGSDRELAVSRILRRAGLPPPVPQFRVRIGSRTYILDYAYPRESVTLEFDGWDVHGTFSAFHADRQRARALVAVGWRLVLVTAQTTPAELVATVRAALALSVHERGA
jgi:very-short-patch-repair endonuclease